MTNKKEKKRPMDEILAISRKLDCEGTHALLSNICSAIRGPDVSFNNAKITEFLNKNYTEDVAYAKNVGIENDTADLLKYIFTGRIRH